MKVKIDHESVKNLIRNIASEVKLERLKRPFSMLPPKPFHFPQFSKLDRPWIAHPVMAEGLEMDALHDIYGMPRDIPQIILTMSGAVYGQEFADFSIEVFGLKGETDQSDEVGRLAARSIGEHIVVSNADPDTIPYGAGAIQSITNINTGECLLKIYIWRWRVFMDNSSLCLENNWHNNDLIGGGWVPYILGIKYDNPEKMVEDTIRFAPAFKLCNLVDATLSRPGRPEGSGWFRSTSDFRTALNDVLSLFSTRPTQLEVLIKLDDHALRQKGPKKPRTQSDTKLLRKWIADAELVDFDTVIKERFPEST
jgi:hypothetical protein